MFKPYSIPSFMGGWETRGHKTQLDKTQVSQIVNMEFREDGQLVFRRGNEVWGPTFPEAVYRIHMFEDLSGNVELFLVTTKHIYQYIPGTKSYFIVDPLGVTPLSGDSDIIPQFCDFGNYCVFVNGVDPVMYWEAGVSDRFDVIPSADIPATARFVTQFMNRVILGYYSDGPNVFPSGLYWCGDGNILDWSLATDLPPGDAGYWIGQKGLTGLEALRDRVALLHNDGISIATYIGGTLVYEFREDVQSQGNISPGSVLVVGDAVFFLGIDQPYSYDLLTTRPIGAPISWWYPRSVKRTWARDHACALWHPDRRQIWFAIPDSASHPGQQRANTILVTDYSTGQFRWTRFQPHRFPLSIDNRNYITAFGLYKAPLDPIAWETALAKGSTWQYYNTVAWGDLLVQEVSWTALMAKADGSIHRIMGDARDSGQGFYVEVYSKLYDMDLPGVQKYVDSLQLNMSITTDVELRIGISEDGDNIIYGPWQRIGAEHINRWEDYTMPWAGYTPTWADAGVKHKTTDIQKIPVRLTAEYFIFGLRKQGLTSSIEDFSLREAVWWYTTRGVRDRVTPSYRTSLT